MGFITNGCCSFYQVMQNSFVGSSEIKFFARLYNGAVN